MDYLCFAYECSMGCVSLVVFSFYIIHLFYYTCVNSLSVGIIGVDYFNPHRFDRFYYMDMDVLVPSFSFVVSSIRFYLFLFTSISMCFSFVVRIQNRGLHFALCPLYAIYPNFGYWISTFVNTETNSRFNTKRIRKF